MLLLSFLVTEDVLHIRQLPDFDRRISPRSCELLLQYLTVPYLRIPLVLQFFAQQEHITALSCPELQEVSDPSGNSGKQRLTIVICVTPGAGCMPVRARSVASRAHQTGPKCGACSITGSSCYSLWPAIQ